MGFLKTAIVAALLCFGNAAPCTDGLCLLNPITDAKNASYSLPSAANFTGFMDAVDCIAGLEHRVCAFMIRTFFHDASRATINDAGRQTGADGSAVINDYQTAATGNAQHGSAAVARYVLRKLVARYGLSYGDALSVAAAQCTQSFDRSGTKHVVAEVCSGAGWPLLVGKLDNAQNAPDTTNSPGPGVFQQPACDNVNLSCTAGQRTVYWVLLYNQLNKILAQSFASGPANFARPWSLSSTDATALIGAHTILPRSSCTTDAAGNLRVASWDNSYFRDVTSGNLTTAPQKDVCVDTNGLSVRCGADIPTGGVVASGCGFSSNAFQARSDSAVNQISRFMRDFGTLEMSQVPVSARWIPDETTRAPCQDSNDPAALPQSQCQACQANSTLPWCTNHGVGEAFFPYLMIDASIGIDANTPGMPCSRPGDPCTAPYNAGNQAFVTEMQLAFRKFAQDVDAWKTAYAVSHCKHSKIAASYAGGVGVDLFSLTRGYSGTCDVDTNADMRALLDEFASGDAGECPCS